MPGNSPQVTQLPLGSPASNPDTATQACKEPLLPGTFHTSQGSRVGHAATVVEGTKE